MTDYSVDEAIERAWLRFQGLHPHREAANEKAQGVVYSIISAAARFWEECPDDFCIQDFSDIGTCIIFGSTNRVIWRAEKGFICDQSYCTDKFKAHFDKLT